MTVPSRGRRSSSPPVPAPGDDESDVEDATLLRRREHEATGTGSESWVGSTMIARRESRRRSARGPADRDAGVAVDIPADGVRDARDPATDAGVYRARAAESVIVPRRPRARSTAHRPAPAPVSGAAARRLAARRLLVAAGGAVALVVVGLVLLAVLLSTL